MLCLVFFTQSAFAWFCNDCKRERNTCRRDLGNCRRNNGDCQDLHKNESAQIAELKARVVELEAQNKNLKIGAGVGAGMGALVLGYIGYAIAQPFRILRDLIVRLIGIVEPRVDEDQA